MSKFNLAKADKGYFIPAEDRDQKKAQKISVGEVVSAKSVDQRNYKLLQKYWVLMDFAFENLPEKYDGYWAIPEDMEEEILKAIGWKKISKDFHGNDVVTAKSISYENCPSDEVFQRIYNRCLDLIFRMLEIEEDSEEMKRLLEFC